ncbi:MAG: DNA polymerase IV, partial [Clostridia bacterium]
MAERAILHCDCNCFFASVECLDNPALKDVCMAVAGDPKDRSGIILAKNELAKAYGVTTAETVWQAKKKCPELVLVPPRHARYLEISRQVNCLYERYTSQVEPFGIDESFLDVTGSLALFETTPLDLANRIREQVKSEIGITISVGVSFNKIFAKLGSDMKKP